MKTIILSKEDFDTTLHTFMWEEMLEELGIDLPDSRDDYPDTIFVQVASAGQI
jgi:hypothetical protein